MRLNRLAATIRSMSVWIGTAVVLSLAGLLVVRQLVPLALLRESNDAVGNYLQTLGTIYAVLLAFVVFVVWQQFNDARANVESEANELLDLTRTVKGLPATIKRPFHEQAAAYVDSVLGPEWTNMSACNTLPLEESGRTLEAMWELLVAYEPSSECHKSLYDEALARFNDLSDRRSNRVLSSRVRIPLALQLLLYTGAVLNVASLYLLAVERLEIHALMTAALSGAIAHILYIIRDLDDAFAGDWQVSRVPFERVRDYIRAVSDDQKLLPRPASTNAP
jgi:hypothetical protein